MKTAYLLHGTGGSNSDYYWFTDIKEFFETKGYNVWWPELPNTGRPELLETERYILDSGPGMDEGSVIIGHSSACPVILHILQNLRVAVKQVILVSGFYGEISDDGYSLRMLPKDGFEWSEIKKHAREIIMINSDNDPWGCSDERARGPAISLGAKLIVNTGQGHMGSDSFEQPYKKFGLVKRLVGEE